jgi:hypothetical protein
VFDDDGDAVEVEVHPADGADLADAQAGAEGEADQIGQVGSDRGLVHGLDMREQAGRSTGVRQRGGAVAGPIDIAADGAFELVLASGQGDERAEVRARYRSGLGSSGWSALFRMWLRAMKKARGRSPAIS